MISTLLIANRGEIAVRIARTCRRLGIRSVAVYPDVDAGAAHLAACDTAVALGPDPRAYLDVSAVMAAVRSSGADAVHPGYGFLSENSSLAQACADAGVAFLGPSADVIESMGSKISAKAIAVAAGVPVVPGRAEPGLTDDDIAAAVEAIGLPVLLKASAGGGGKGMRVVSDLAEVRPAMAAARREAAAAFGDDALMVERFVAEPRHIEVQILGDTHGNVVALSDRECSLQRRHQKVIEEAPVTSLPTQVRAAIAADAVAVAKAVGYVGAGTVEFIVDAREHYFLEMNTRLQVEHPVTEAVTGLDLVAWQIAVAEGASVAELHVSTTGVAVEARIYAEDPATGFLPTGGRLLVCDLPDGVRVDAGVRAGDEVGSHYDPMLAKIIAHGPDRAGAYRALAGALRRTTLLGVTTNVGYLGRLLDHDRVIRNDVHTRLLDELTALRSGDDPPPEVLAAAALDRWLAPPAQGWADPWSARTGWRLGEPSWARWRLRVGDEVHDVALRACADGRVEVAGFGAVRARRSGQLVEVQHPGGTSNVTVARSGDRVWLALDGRAWSAVELSQLSADRDDVSSAALAPVRSPMPGTVIAVAAAAGARVSAGEPLVTVEAMKMEHTLRAPAEGTVAAVLVAVGDRVVLEQDLLRWEADDV